MRRTSGFTMIRTSLRENLDIVQGFTMIEILVVMVIMGFFIVMGFSGFRDFQRRQTISSAVRTVLADMRKAQSDANSGVKPAACVGRLLGYSFEVDTQQNPASYNVKFECLDPGPPVNANDGIVKHTELIGTIKLTKPHKIIFKALAGGVDRLTGPPFPRVYDITNTELTGDAQRIVVSELGEIHVEIP